MHTPAAYAVAGMVFADTEADAEGLGAEGLLGVEFGVEFELQAAARNATATTATRRVFGIRGAYPARGYLQPAGAKKVPVARGWKRSISSASPSERCRPAG